MATHSRILAWKTPWTKEPGGLQSMGLQRVRQDWVAEDTHTQLIISDDSPFKACPLCAIYNQKSANQVSQNNKF